MKMSQQAKIKKEERKRSEEIHKRAAVYVEAPRKGFHFELDEALGFGKLVANKK